jgi:outer membrane protein OmpA-like peptidoglycan-associated protein/ABC-type nitrate/sulfonate/bicarbonate transport system substrate-binding protein
VSTGTRIARFLVIVLLLAGFGYGVYTKYVKPAPEQVLREKTSQIERAPSLSVVVDSWIGSMPIQLIKARAYDQELGFNLKVSYAESDLDRMTMLSKNEVEATSIAVNSWVKHQDRFKDTGVAVLKIDDSYGADALVVNSSRVKTVNDLVNKKVAFVQDGIGEYFLYYLLKIVGLGPADVVAVPQKDMKGVVAEFKAGRVDAAVSWEPEITTQLLPVPGAKRLVSTKEASNLIVDVGIVTRKAISEKPDLVEKFVKAWFWAIRYMTEHPDAAYERLAETLPKDVYGTLTKQDLVDMFKGVKMTTFTENQRTFGLAGVAEDITPAVETANQVYLGTAKMTTKLDPAKMVHAGFIGRLGNDPTVVPTLDPAISGVKKPEPTKPPELGKVQPGEVEGKTEAVAKLAVDKIHFASGSPALDQNSRAILDQVASTMRHFPAYYLLIEGHTDSDGDDNSNMRLSQERCDSVKGYLVSRGFPENQFITRGFGESRPIASNATADGKAQNRRTEFRLVAQKGQW